MLQTIFTYKPPYLFRRVSALTSNGTYNHKSIIIIIIICLYAHQYVHTS
jgi:hypothetical protein